MEGSILQEEEMKRIMTNPFYCLDSISLSLTEPHTPLISEALWIKSGVNLIKEIGAEEYLKNLLENLKGNYL